MVKCKVCGRELKQAKSIERGCGIVCSKKSEQKRNTHSLLEWI